MLELPGEEPGAEDTRQVLRADLPLSSSGELRSMPPSAEPSVKPSGAKPSVELRVEVLTTSSADPSNVLLLELSSFEPSGTLLRPLCAGISGELLGLSNAEPSRDLPRPSSVEPRGASSADLSGHPILPSSVAGSSGELSKPSSAEPSIELSCESPGPSR